LKPLASKDITTTFKTPNFPSLVEVKTPLIKERNKLITILDKGSTKNLNAKSKFIPFDDDDILTHHKSNYMQMHKQRFKNLLKIVSEREILKFRKKIITKININYFALK
jgi:hypothetical protein